MVAKVVHRDNCLRVGLLLNFNCATLRDGIKRFVL